MMITPASKKDIKLIQDLARESWQSTYAHILRQEQIDYMLEMMYSETTLLKHFDNPNYFYYLVTDRHQYFGFFGYEKHAQPKTTKLHRIYFLSRAQGRGLGKMSLDFIKQEALKNGDEQVLLTVNKNNSALQFYQSQGFEISSEAVFDIGGGYVMDDFIMISSLKST